MLEDKRKKLQYTFIILGVGFIALIVYGFFFYSGPNPYGDELKIANLSDYTNGKPFDEDSVDFIQHQLLITINMNNDKEYGNHSIKDVYVRSGSFSQKLKESNHTVSFLVDIKSIQQSYFISYDWSDNNKLSSTTVDGWSTGVRCPTTDQLIYSAFDCRDEFSVYTDTIDTTLDKYLPYTSPYYTISYVKNDEGTTINVQIMSNNNSTNTKRFFEEYKQSALSWLQSKEDVNLEDYTIVYRNFSNEVVAE